MKINIDKISKNTAHTETWLSEEEVATQKDKAVDSLIKTVSIDGFRRGKAPKSIAASQIDPDKLSNLLLENILNEVVKEIVKQQKFRLLGRPLLRDINSKSDKGWLIKISFPLYPEINLLEYKKLFSKEKSNKKNQKSSGNQQEKLDKIRQILLKKVDFDLPVETIEEEVSNSLNRLENQAKTLNLTLENYLKAVNKNLDQVKDEYAKKAEESIKLDIILMEITRLEKIDTSLDEIKQIAQKEGVPHTDFNHLRSIINRQKTIELLLNLC